MTEDYTIKDADYIVRVKAQVMTRDDSSGGWVPMGGGGMSEVGLRKIVICKGDELLHEYHIHGQKLFDRSVVLNCVLKKDVQYIKANPTFHHWKTEENRFGLTFQSSAEARAFDKGVKRAVEDLIEGYNDSNDCQVEVGDDDVFMTMDLPLGRTGSWSASTASTTTSSPSPHSPAFSLHDIPPPSNHHHHHHHHQQQQQHSYGEHLHRMHYIHRPPPPPPQKPPDIWLLKPEKEEDMEIKDLSYVEFNKSSKPPPPPQLSSGGGGSHEYSYPTLDCVSGSSQQQQQQITTATTTTVELPLPIKSKKKKVPTATLR